MSKSNVLEADVLNHQYRAATWAKPASVWVALFTADPTDAGTGAEVTGGGYARQQVTCTDANWTFTADDGAGNAQIANANAITFASPTANQGTISHWATMSAVTGGTVRHHGALTSSINATAGSIGPSFQAGAIVIKEG